jgi:hypothetical protein
MNLTIYVSKFYSFAKIHVKSYIYKYFMLNKINYLNELGHFTQGNETFLVYDSG